MVCSLAFAMGRTAVIINVAKQHITVRCRSIAAKKALTDGMFAVLFSTTPPSASRNYSVNIPSVNAF
jgi:hypothetical protein